jgi:hypothetical protein
MTVYAKGLDGVYHDVTEAVGERVVGQLRAMEDMYLRQGDLLDLTLHYTIVDGEPQEAE